MTAQHEPFDLLISRELNAPVSLVFRLWEAREHMVRWWGPRNFTCTHLETDFRPGGKWRACIKSDEWGEAWMSGVYKEIEKDRRIVFSFSWEESQDGEGVDTLVTVEFEERDGRTIQRFHQAPFHTQAGRDSHVSGWSECLDKEVEHLGEMTPAQANA